MASAAIDNVRSGLVMEQLALQLKEALTEGRLAPGQRFVEGTWGREFGAAQPSVREAINLLVSEGFDRGI